MHGGCEDMLVPVLAKIGADSGPVFLNFDGWGRGYTNVASTSHQPLPFA